MNWWQSRSWLSNSICLSCYFFFSFSISISFCSNIYVIVEWSFFGFVRFAVDFPAFGWLLESFTLNEVWPKVEMRSEDRNWNDLNFGVSQCDFHFSRSAQKYHTLYTCVYSAYRSDSGDDGNGCVPQWHDNFNFTILIRKLSASAHTPFLHKWRNRAVSR